MSIQFSVRMNISDNVFRTRYKDFIFDLNYIDSVCTEIVDQCKDHVDFTASYQYDKIVLPLIEKRYISSMNRKAFYKAIHNYLEKLIMSESWHDGARAARRSIDCKLAYMTAGFSEAKTTSLLYNT